MRRPLEGALVVSIGHNASVTVTAKSLVRRDVRNIEIKWVPVLFSLPPADPAVPPEVGNSAIFSSLQKKGLRDEGERWEWDPYIV
jgi:hypothetical protein